MQRYREAILYIVLLVVALIFTMSQLKPAIVNTFNTNKELSTKKSESEDLERRIEAIKAADIKKNTRATLLSKKIYKPSESGLDPESSFSILFDDVIEMAKFNNIKVYAIEYTYNPESDDFVKGAASKYNVCQLSMQVISDYADLESFLKELYKYPYLLNISKIEMMPYAKNKKILLTNLQLKLYSEK